MIAHSKAFFGQKTGLILSSGTYTDEYIYLSFLKKKADGSWQKLKNKEGKNIKLNLIEMVNILDVLEGKQTNWSTVHRYKNEQTQIYVKQGQNDSIQISTPGYSKSIAYPETRILKDLLFHIYEEKIVNSTISNQKIQTSSVYKKTTIKSVNSIPERQIPKSESAVEFDDFIQGDINGNPSAWYDNLEKEEDFCLLPGHTVSQKEKAISFQIEGLKSIWIPLSQIRDVELIETLGGVWAKDWIVRKNMEEIFSTA